jgi:RodZ C-terminal domain
MWIFVAAVVVVAVGALVVAALMRPGGDDVSVRSYHSTLGTLEHLSHPERRARRPAGRSPGEAGPHAGYFPPVPPHAERGDEESPAGAEPLVFDDARPRDRGEPPPAETASARARRVQRIALDSMERRPRRGVGIAVVVIALVAFAALAYVGSRRSNPPARTSATRTTTHARSVTSTTVHRSSSARSHGRSGSASSTTSTTPTRIVAATTSSTGTTATYPVGKNDFTVLISASGPCWIDVTTAATGATLFTGTLQAGASQSVPATGATTVELGATGSTMTVDGTPVVLPTPLHTPFVATFQPTAPATSPATTAPSAG